MERKQIVERNPVIFCKELQRLVQEGYEIDENENFNMVFHLYTISMKKAEVNEEEVAKVFKKAGRPRKED